MSKRDKRNETRPRSPTTSGDKEVARLSRRHMRLGWWSLLVFLSLGMVLETLHGFKLHWYVGVENSTRRLMWTLAHTHGTLLALIHLAFAAAVDKLGASFGRFRGFGSACLYAAGFLLPMGFFAGGVVIYDGDPGLGVLLVPMGGAFLFISVLLTALAVQRST